MDKLQKFNSWISSNHQQCGLNCRENSFPANVLFEASVTDFWKASDSGTFYRPEWKSTQNHKNLNISQATNVITMKLYTNIVLRKANILQEILRPQIYCTRLFTDQNENYLRFWSVQLSEIVFCDLNSIE